MEYEKQKRQSNPLGLVLKILGALFLLCILGVGAIFSAAFLLTQDVAAAGDAFMQAIQENRLEDAYGMLRGAAADEIDEDAFTELFSDSELTSWVFSGRSFENNDGELTGTATFAGETYDVILLLAKQDETWYITGYSFEPVESEGSED